MRHQGITPSSVKETWTICTCLSLIFRFIVLGMKGHFARYMSNYNNHVNKHIFFSCLHNYLNVKGKKFTENAYMTIHT